MALSGNLAPGEESLLVQIKGQMEANRKAHDDYVAARSAGNKAGMDLNQHGFQAFEAYAEQYRREAGGLDVKGEPGDDDIPVASISPAERDVGSVPKEPDPEFVGPVPGGDTGDSAEASSGKAAKK